MNDEHLRYPIGKFAPQDNYTAQERVSALERLGAFPEQLERAVQALSSEKLNTPYRDGGWTARQVVHHLADSHTHAYIRLKWTLTEDAPLIKAYHQQQWAETPEVDADPGLSVNLLKALHPKLVALFSALSPEQFKREFVHPEGGKRYSVDRLLALYAWHGEHHLEHLHIIARK